MTKNVVYVGAHPDDILSVAGTLCLLAEAGFQIHEFCLTRGEGLPGGRERRPPEEEKVCAIIGATLAFFDQPDGAIYADKPICTWVAEEFKRLEPVAVFTTWALEKPDHAATYQITHKALSLSSLFWTTELYMGKVDIQNYAFRPDMYVNVGAAMQKIEAIAACYDSQSTNPYVQNALRRKKDLGAALFVEAAEGLMYGMDPINKRFGRESEVGRILRKM